MKNVFQNSVVANTESINGGFFFLSWLFRPRTSHYGGGCNTCNSGCKW